MRRNNMSQASRLACASIALRSYLCPQGTHESTNQDGGNGAACMHDENDLVFLLNFFARIMLRIRIFLHKPNQDPFLLRLYIQNVSPLVGVYRALVAFTFKDVSCEDNLSAFLRNLLDEPVNTAFNEGANYYAVCEFHGDPYYTAALKACTFLAKRKAGFAPLTFARQALNVGGMMVNATDRILTDNEEAPLHAQQVLCRLLVCHDREVSPLFTDGKALLRLQAASVA